MRCEDYVMQEIYVDHTLIKDEDLGSRNGFDWNRRRRRQWKKNKRGERDSLDSTQRLRIQKKPLI